MSTQVVADLRVQDGAATRTLNVDDLNGLPAGAATEVTLAAALAALGDILTELQGALTVLGTVAISNQIPAVETGLAKDVTLTDGSLRAAIYANGANVSGANPLPTTSSFADENGVPFNSQNPLPVDVGGSITIDNLTVQFESVIAAAQVPAAPMAANEVFTGPWDDVTNYASIAAVIFTDQYSAINGVEAQFSHDGSSVVRAVPTTIPPNFGAFFEMAPEARYFRIVYRNGATPQTILRAQVIYRFNPGVSPVQPLGSTITDANVAGVERAMLTGREATGAWRSVAVSSTGQVQVAGPLTDAQLRATPFSVTLANPTADPETGLAKDVTLAQVRDRASFPMPEEQFEALIPPASPTDYPLPDAQAVLLTPPTPPDDYPLPQAQIDALTPPGAITGFATETTVAAVRDRLPAALEDGSLSVSDTYATLEALPSQPGANGVLTFTFSAPRVLVWARSRGGVSYARVGADPASGVGVPLADDEPHPMTVRTSELRVWAPAGATVFVWGYA